MKVAYLDCFSGISGDMTLGALLHAGLDLEVLLAELGKLDLPGYRVETQLATRGSITGFLVNVHVEKDQPARGLKEIVELIDGSDLCEEVREKSRRIFELLGEAEAGIHGVDLSSVHFHEVGAVDSIVDIVGSVIGFEMLGIQRLTASPVNVGKGMVKTEHGQLPVPAPATTALLQGRPTYSRGVSRELTTPTGAALLAGLAREFGDQPPMKVEQIGYGLGSSDISGWPNCLRILIGEANSLVQDQCWMIESNIDDMNPEVYGFVMERLLAQGALDVFFTPIIMKKGRPATRISVLSPFGQEEALTQILFLETTAIGVRRYRVERNKLDRKVIQVATRYGNVPVKVAFLEGDVVNVAPEYDTCRDLATAQKVPLKKIYNEALRSVKEAME